jgi:hypothetical protein
MIEKYPNKRWDWYWISLNSFTLQNRNNYEKFINKYFPLNKDVNSIIMSFCLKDDYDFQLIQDYYIYIYLINLGII